MARIYTIEEAPVPPPDKRGASWQRTIRITMNPSSMPNYGELDRWTRQNLKGTYILMAFMSQHIAGGAFGLSHNANLTHCPDRPISVDYYELRLTNQQAADFLKVWRIPKREYEENLASYYERENARQGWTKVDGCSLGTHEIVALARKAPGGALKRLIRKRSKTR